MGISEGLWAVGIIITGWIVYRDIVRVNKEVAKIGRWINENRIEEEERDKWWQENKEKHW